MYVFLDYTIIIHLFIEALGFALLIHPNSVNLAGWWLTKFRYPQARSGLRYAIREDDLPLLSWPEVGCESDGKPRVGAAGCIAQLQQRLRYEKTNFSGAQNTTTSYSGITSILGPPSTPTVTTTSTLSQSS